VGLTGWLGAVVFTHHFSEMIRERGRFRLVRRAACLRRCGRSRSDRDQS